MARLNFSAREYGITEDDRYVFIYLNYTHSEHQITIKGTQVLPEFQPNILAFVFGIPLIIIAVTAMKQRRKLRWQSWCALARTMTHS